ncbi:MAG: type I restriction enzyme HsdR N-terminal domain-containing protein [Prevotellaceae bacterium]|jgi:type I site-specific restriction endonuclease|nr:type I restriction enzyme HsdR N-terminal domain-containing protein [Prevotellaceae bacterium]
MENFIPHVRTVNGKQEIFDIIRKKFVALTPEETVRQQLLHYLTTVKKFPEGLLQVETCFSYAKRTFRADVVAYNRYLKPLLIAECKAPEVKIVKETYEQISRYNLVLKVPYLLVTNGQQHFFFYFDIKKCRYALAAEMAEYEELISNASPRR